MMKLLKYLYEKFSLGLLNPAVNRLMILISYFITYILLNMNNIIYADDGSNKSKVSTFNEKYLYWLNSDEAKNIALALVFVAAILYMSHIYDQSRETHYNVYIEGYKNGFVNGWMANERQQAEQAQQPVEVNPIQENNILHSILEDYNFFTDFIIFLQDHYVV